VAEVRTTSTTGGQKGTKLQRFDLLPTGPLTALAEHYGVGASKYADNNYRRGYEWSKSYAALQRHLTDFWAGKDYDVCSNDPDGCRHTDMDGNPFDTGEPDTCFNHTGSHHMIAAAWHAFCLFEFAMHHPNHDDRFETETWIDFDKITDEILGINERGILSPEHWDKVRAGAEKILAEDEFDRTKTWVPGEAFPSTLTGDDIVQAGAALGFEVQLRPARGSAIQSVQESLDRRG